MEKKEDVESKESKEEKKENQGGRDLEKPPVYRLMKTIIVAVATIWPPS